MIRPTDHGVRITYVVNHGIRAPRVTLKSKVMGGDIEVLALGDVSRRLDDAENLLREALEVIVADEFVIRQKIRDFLNE